MSLTIFLDADFLSAFLKIGKLHLVKDFYDVEVLKVPVAVYREVSLTTLLPSLAALPWIEVTALDPGAQPVLDPDFIDLGKGEQEVIQLSMSTTGALLLTNDLKARRIAHRLGPQVGSKNTFRHPVLFLAACVCHVTKLGARRETRHC